MRCPNCNSLNTYVKDSRPKQEETRIVRRHECRDCGYRFTTYQIYKDTYDELTDDYAENIEKFKKLLKLVLEVVE